MTIQGLRFDVPVDCSLRYVWVAEYSDGTFFSQFDVDGKEQLFGDIEQDKLSAFHFMSLMSQHKVTLKLTKDMRLICFRRHRQGILASQHLHSPGHDVLYHLGFQKTIGGKNVKFIAVIDGNGCLEITDGEDDGHID